jgi:hypothetical protein
MMSKRFLTVLGLMTAGMLLPGADEALATATAAQTDDGAAEQVVTVVSEQLVLWATVAGAIAALPTLLEYLAERRRRREQLALSLEDQALAERPAVFAGVDALLADNVDLTDAARHPEAFPGLSIGNEILVIGGRMTGKKSLAMALGRAAGMERVLTLYDAADADVLVAAMTRLRRARGRRYLLLLPHIDRIIDRDEPGLRAQLESLVESASQMGHVLVIGTTTVIEPDSALDDLFGVKLLMPGTVPDELRPVPQHPAAQAYHRAVAKHFLARMAPLQVEFDGLNEEECIALILDQVGNPAEIEDVVNLCLTTAIHRQRVAGGARRVDVAVLDRALARTLVGRVGGRSASSDRD